MPVAALGRAARVTVSQQTKDETQQVMDPHVAEYDELGFTIYRVGMQRPHARPLCMQLLLRRSCGCGGGCCLLLLLRRRACWTLR